MSTQPTQANRPQTTQSATRKPARKPAPQRLDLLLVSRGLAETLDQARRLIMAGEVLVGEQVSDKPGTVFPEDAEIRVRGRLPYVSRGGQKLEAALHAFDLAPAHKTAIDVGASTGGFTDCLLQHGVDRVYAIDVGYGELAWKLRNDPRVVALERTNIRNLAHLPEHDLAQLAVIDASFISLALVLPPTLNLLAPVADIVALIKPQFEAGQADVGKGGVVRDASVHRRVIEETLALAQSLHLAALDLIVSPLLGPAGNVEFLVHLRRDPARVPLPALDETVIPRALEAAQNLRKPD